MTGNDRPLPTPPRSRFGRDSQDDAAPAPLTSDRMALAAAEGRLEEFLHQEIPQGGHAHDLAMMMMGMSGMMPAAGAGVSPRPPVAEDPAATPAGQDPPPPEVPPEVRAAIEQGDVAGLMGILRAEHAKRAGLPAVESGAPPPADRQAGTAQPPPGAQPPPAAGEGRPGIDAAVIDELIRIAAENDVTVDWLMLRAVKLYVAEHRKTGRL